MPDRDDADLARLVRLAEPPEQVPSFQSMWSAARAQAAAAAGRRCRLAAAVAAGVAVALSGGALGLALWWTGRQAPLPARHMVLPPVPITVPLQVAALTRWRAPLDFLLDTPGSELLSSTPAMGSLPAWASVELTMDQQEGHHDR